MRTDAETPRGWTKAAIRDLCDLNPKHPKDTEEATEVSFVPMEAVDATEGAIKAPEIRTFGEVRRGYCHFRNGDVLWAKITPCMENGKSAVAERLENGIGCGSTEFMVLRGHGGVEPDFLHRFLRQESYRKAAKRTMKSGVGQARVPKAFLLGTELPIPPLPEQRRIVEKTDALQEHSRAAREALDAIPPLLEKFRQSVLAAAFRGDLTREWRARNPAVEPASVLLERIRAERRARWIEDAAEKARGRAETRARKAGKDWGAEDDARALERERAKAAEKYVAPEPVDEEGLPGLPEGWCWVTLDEISCTITSGSRDWRKYYGGGDGVFILAGNVKRGRLDLREVQLVDPPHHDPDAQRSQVQVGDLLVTIVGANTGDVCTVREELPKHYVCQSVALVRPVLASLSDWTLPYFVAGPGRKQFEDLMYGQGRPHLGFDDLRRCWIPLAPQEEMDRLLSLLSGYADGLTSVADSLSAQRERLRILDQSVLARAFRGELVPQDPNDEPASALLNRIRAEREAAEAESNAKKKKATRRPRKKAAEKKSGARKRRGAHSRNAT